MRAWVQETKWDFSSVDFGVHKSTKAGAAGLKEATPFHQWDDFNGSDWIKMEREREEEEWVCDDSVIRAQSNTNEGL